MRRAPHSFFASATAYVHLGRAAYMMPQRPVVVGGPWTGAVWRVHTQLRAAAALCGKWAIWTLCSQPLAKYSHLLTEEQRGAHAFEGNWNTRHALGNLGFTVRGNLALNHSTWKICQIEVSLEPGVMKGSAGVWFGTPRLVLTVKSKNLKFYEFGLIFFLGNSQINFYKASIFVLLKIIATVSTLIC